jgi:hypothetical protein
VSWLRAVNDRFQSMHIEAGQIGNDAFQPDSVDPYAEDGWPLWGMRTRSRGQG